MNYLYDPKVSSLTLAQDPKILDEYLNEWLIIGSHDAYLKKYVWTIYVVLEFILSSSHKTQGFG